MGGASRCLSRRLIGLELRDSLTGTRDQAPPTPRVGRRRRAASKGVNGLMEKDGEGVKKLKEVLRRYRKTRAKGVTVDQRPGCVYGMLTREQVDDLVKDIEDLKATLNKIYVSLILMLSGLVINVLLAKLGVV